MIRAEQNTPEGTLLRQAGSAPLSLTLEDKMTKHYDIPEDEKYINSSELNNKPHEFQIEVMRTWFYQNYQNPVHECPYDGQEGGYQYIHGGPYEAAEELFDEFGGVIDDEVIGELAEDLEAECSEWSGIPKPEDYDDYLFDIVGTIEKPYEELMTSIEDLKAMISMALNGNKEQTMLKMVFTNTITVLEAYLSEYFIGRIESEPYSLRKFVESNKDFKQEKISLSEIFKEKENIENYTKEYLVDLLWHNIQKINILYQNTLGIEFPVYHRESN